MAELSVSVSKNAKIGTRKLDAFVRKAPKQIKEGLGAAGNIVLKQWKRNISGTGFTRNPGRSSRFPGVNTGMMLSSMFRKLEATEVHIGPSSIASYAVYHETGTKNMPARPVVEPTWDMVGQKAIDKFVDIAMRPLRI